MRFKQIIPPSPFSTISFDSSAFSDEVDESCTSLFVLNIRSTSERV
jgi:hypothetical protein